MRQLPAVLVLAGLCALPACGSPHTAAAGSNGPHAAPAQVTHAAARASTGTSTEASAATRALVRAITISQIRAPDGSVVTVAIFRGPLRYVLHNGSRDPGPLATGVVHAGQAVTGAERKQLLAAFNGGFKLSAGAGGYEQEGHVISPLRDGFASLVIDRSGHARIGVWGQGVPVSGEAVHSVRQNLQPLVVKGRPAVTAAAWRLWGATVGGAEYVARSALGQDASGNLIYAASMHTNPADLAYALIRAGARIAMELDINPEWVQLDAASTPGGRLTAEVPGQNRPAGQYLTGWTRDFIAVLAH